MAGFEISAIRSGRPPIPRTLSRWTGFLLAQAHVRGHAIFQAALTPLELTPKGFGALATLAETGPISQVALGEAMRVDRTTIVAVIDELQKHGFVERNRNPLDRRVYSLELTDAGRATLSQAEAAAVSAHAQLLADLTEDEQQQLQRLLARIVTGQPVPGGG